MDTSEKSNKNRKMLGSFLIISYFCKMKLKQLQK